MNHFKEKLEIETLKALTYTQINELLNKITLERNQLKNKVEKLKDENEEIILLSKDFVNEVDKKHPFVNLPDEEDFYISRHKLVDKIDNK